MAQKAIREAQGKKMIARLLKDFGGGKYTVEDNFISVGPETDLNALTREYPWLESTKVVVKPDQLIKRRGKNGLLRLNAGWNEAREWITEKMGNEITIDGGTGLLDHFIVEPYGKHDQDDEYYVTFGREIIDNTDIEDLKKEIEIFEEQCKDENHIYSYFAKLSKPGFIVDVIVDY